LNLFQVSAATESGQLFLPTAIRDQQGNVPSTTPTQVRDLRGKGSRAPL